MRFDEVVLDNLTANQMFLNDPFEHRRVAGPIPGALRIDDSDRSAFADPQAVGFCAEDSALFRQSQLFQSPLEIVPCFEATRLLAALRRRLIGAQEDVTPRHRNANVGGNLALGIGHEDGLKRERIPRALLSNSRKSHILDLSQKRTDVANCALVDPPSACAT